MPGITRSFDSFSEAALENGRSRVYLGVHWDFDDTQGQALGRQVANLVSQNHFQAVPEPSTMVLTAVGAALAGFSLWKRKSTV